VITTRELRRRYELTGPQQTIEHLTEALRERHLRPEDFSLRDLAEGLVPDGHEWVRTMDPRSATGVSLLEAGDGVDVTAFLNVASQIIYSKIMDAYTQEAFVVSNLVDTIPTRMDGEKFQASRGSKVRPTRCIRVCLTLAWDSAKTISKPRRRPSADSSCR